MKKFSTLVFIVCIITASPASSFTKFDSLITAGINQIYSIEFGKAQSTFEILRKEYPAHPAGKFFDAMTIWWEIMLDMENEEYDDLFLDKLEDGIDFCDELLEKNPENVDALFFKGGALGFRGRLYSIRESWLNAALDGKDALPLVYKAYDLDSTNVDVQMGFGIYNYYAEVIPEKYPFVKPFMIFFPGGDREKGLRQLEHVAFNGKYAKIESLYFLMTIYYKFEENFDQAIRFAKILVDKFPDNPTFEKYYGRIYVRKGRYQSAAEIFFNIYEKCREGLYGYFDKNKREAAYYIANDYYLRNKLDSAKTYFQICKDVSLSLDEDEDSGFLVNSALYLGMIYDLQGKRSKAVKEYEDVLDYDEYSNSQDKAESFIKNPFKK